MQRALAHQRELPVHRRPPHLDAGEELELARSGAELSFRRAAAAVAAHLDRRCQKRNPADRMGGDRPALVEMVLDAHPHPERSPERVADGEGEVRLDFEHPADVEELGRHGRKRCRSAILRDRRHGRQARGRDLGDLRFGRSRGVLGGARLDSDEHEGGEQPLHCPPPK